MPKYVIKKPALDTIVVVQTVLLAVLLLTCNVYMAKYFTFIAQLDPNFIGLDTVEHLLLAGVLHGTTNRQLCIAQIPMQPLRKRKNSECNFEARASTKKRRRERHSNVEKRNDCFISNDKLGLFGRVGAAKRFSFLNQFCFFLFSWLKAKLNTLCERII